MHTDRIADTDIPDPDRASESVANPARVMLEPNVVAPELVGRLFDFVQ
jgi:hypothetical protein